MALTLAATPLGNPGDASPRLKDAIANAEVIAAEDSRRFHRLCSDIEVTFTGRVISFFDGNETERTQEILELLRAGKNVLVVSDAGMPTISDPGFRLARDAIAENLAVTVIPGPSAVLSALILSGLPTDRFSFEGFIARKGKERTEILNNLNTQSRTMVLFESPRRTLQTLQDIQEVVGENRKAAVVREISKTYEEVIRGSISDLVSWAQAKEVLGEITLVIAGVENTGKKEVDEEAIRQVKQLVDGGSSFKDAVQEVSTQQGLSRRELYEASLRLDS